ncbi:adenine phosphoribosyltransferase [Helicobacter fennelliae]|uniref:Adenine phosphoribosyltransferase n=2 Tax=Helicobacter fennelliae TaxID=215 RepID=T1DXA7_9HELI|nr:adenine phosphoribosyltransferase [Helicobacter fennelliae]GAD20097.1 adenine phosphoribosyltransferase [Helicobacter fennelliae MRY12-0050]SQB98268.1 adenine phosphoribosyltransferase [Helicobacter fennelliae]STP14357.1 adenine phosphoribosyltransferase [Helicobacter fennelliae]
MQTLQQLQAQVKQNLRQILDYPKKGIIFRDITTLLAHAEVFGNVISFLKNRYEKHNITHIVGIESRGFIFGSALAYALGVGFVPVRKKGKLPSKTYTQDYALEYGTDTLEIHIDAFDFKPACVVLIDDLLATGGTAKASLELIKKAGGECIEACFLLRLLECGSVTLPVSQFHILDI